MKKRYLILFLSLILVGLFTGCNKDPQHNDVDDQQDELDQPKPQKDSCVVYFSATNQTKKVAEKIAETIESDIYEIVPATLYTSSDLNYSDSNSRATQEQNNPNARPEIKNEIPVEEYQRVYLGYPIWWGTLPKIIYTFCDRYDLENVTIIPFCTSGSTGISTSVADLKKLEPKANILDGKRFTSASESEVQSFINDHKEEITLMKIKIEVNGHTLTALLEDNAAAKAFYELVQAGLTLELSEYGGFEKVGPIGKPLPSNDTSIHAQPGDLILYSSNQLSLMYGSNTWSYTKLGKIENLDQIQLETILGSGDVTVTFTV